MGIISYINDLLFPVRCLGCEILLPNDKRFVCTTCLKSLTSKFQRCAFCNVRSKHGRTCSFCSRKYYLDQLITSADYGQILVEKMVKGLKYRFIKNIANDMIAKLASKVVKEKADVDLDIISWVPMNRVRQNWRGYNQAQELGERLASCIQVPHFALLTKTKSGSPQAETKKKEDRFNNIKGSFEVLSGDLDLIGQRIAVVDDVATSAATLNECANVLKNAGATSVVGFVFAKED